MVVHRGNPSGHGIARRKITAKKAVATAIAAVDQLRS
jgi:hypothetical protein